jgi:Mg2+/Co2+ transporter CorC
MENNTQLNCNIYELETKIAAFSHILKVSQAMGTNFSTYVDQVLPILYKHFGYLARQVRKTAIKTLQYCLTARNGEPALLHAMFD